MNKKLRPLIVTGLLFCCTFFVVADPLPMERFRGVAETAGPSSRRCGFTISEVMYHPAARTDGLNAEFIELHNAQPFAEDISGFRISGELDAVIPEGTLLAADGYLVIAPVPADVEAIYGISGVLAATGTLSNSSGNIRLRNELDAVMIDFEYQTDHPWPVAADGGGPSLELYRPSYGEAQFKAWAASAVAGGTPGQAVNTVVVHAWSTIMINEVLSHTDDPVLDYVELYNYSEQVVDLAGCILTDDVTENRFVIPAGTQITAGGFVHFDQAELGFSLSAAGETLWLKDSAGQHIIDVRRFGAMENGVSCGRYPDGSPQWSTLESVTPGTANSGEKLGDVVINEVMYHPISEDDADEFIELYNRSGAAIDLEGWRFIDGVDYVFPAGAQIAAGDYVVVAADKVKMLTTYPSLTADHVYGDWDGQLSNGSERLALAKPEELRQFDGSNWSTSMVFVVEEAFTWFDAGDWERLADGGGSSLERISPNESASSASRWRGSDESNSSGWVTIEYSGTLEWGPSDVSPTDIQVIMQGEGECLIDNIEVHSGGGVNLVANSDFSAGANNWTGHGTLKHSGWVSDQGDGGGGAYLLKSTGRGDNCANRVLGDLYSLPSTNSEGTIRARVRCLKGNPDILFVLKGNWLEAYGTALTTTALGTPGAVNSAYAENEGPAITDVLHQPVLPEANEAVMVTAKILDGDDVIRPILKYRIDPSTTYSAVAMESRGAGYYSASIPGQSSGAMVAFYISAGDALSQFRTYPADLTYRECLIRFGEANPDRSLGVYRLWMTDAVETEWADRGRNSNAPLPVTYVYNNERVIYGAESLYSGSPWRSRYYDSPTGNIADFVLHTPPDDLMLGSEDFVLASCGNQGDDDIAQREQIAVWMLRKLGLPYIERRFIHMYVNGHYRSVPYEDAQQPAGDYVDEWFPDKEEGTFFKIQDWFEFDDDGDGNAEFDDDARLLPYPSSDHDGYTKARYRWTWRRRMASREMNDYDELFNLVDKLDSSVTDPYDTDVPALVDTETWARLIAVQRFIGNWDSYGYERGKNVYLYLPQYGSWQLLAWDMDAILGNRSRDTSAESNILSSSFKIEDSAMQTLFRRPWFARAYFRAMRQLCDEVIYDPEMQRLADDKRAVLLADGFSLTEANSVVYSWMTERRSYVLGDISSYSNVGFNITPDVVNTSVNYVTLTGTAPVEAAGILVDGVPHQVDWTAVNGWSLSFVAAAGSNNYTLQGSDADGVPISGVSDTVSVNVTGTLDEPEDHVAISEIMYHPVAEATAFIELANLSGNTSYDLGGWRLDGVDVDFPAGAILPARSFGVVVQDPGAFAQKYGNFITVLGTFSGSLDKGGETLQLLIPGAASEEDQLLDEVAYDDDLPWPPQADGNGASLQIVNTALDNNRVANWCTTYGDNAQLVNSDATWSYYQSGEPTGNWKSPDYDDSQWPVDQSVFFQENSDLSWTKRTELTIGQPTYYFRTTFDAPAIGSSALILETLIDDGAVMYLNGTEIYRIGVAADPPTHNDPSSRTVTNALVEGPFVLPSSALVVGENVLAVEVHQISTTSTDVVMGIKLSAESSSAGPGAATRGTSLSYLPDVWLNEVHPASGNAWVEVYNSGSSLIDLSAYNLSNDYDQPARWSFAVGTKLAPGAFLQVGLAPDSTITPHSDFSVPASTGRLVLSTEIDGERRIIDYLNYAAITADRSYGAFPDGTPTRRIRMYYATPAATNRADSPPSVILINEWMADNEHTLADPIDSKYQDWFELYNPGGEQADLSGWTLSDNAARPGKYTIIDGTMLAAGAFMVVWADEESDQTTLTSPHCNFKLSAGGEQIFIYRADGTLSDAISFGEQQSDISQGRVPDGSETIEDMLPNSPAGANRNAATESYAISGLGSDSLEIEAYPGLVYRIEYCELLNNTGWTTLMTTTAVDQVISIPIDQLTTDQVFLRVLKSRP